MEQRGLDDRKQNAARGQGVYQEERDDVLMIRACKDSNMFNKGNMHKRISTFRGSSADAEKENNYGQVKYSGPSESKGQK